MLGGQLQGSTPVVPNGDLTTASGGEGFSTLAGSPFFVLEGPPSQTAESLPNQGFNQLSFTQSPDRPPGDLKGRITGPVRLVQQIARAWNLSTGELVNLLAYPTEGLVSALLDGRITFWPETDRGDRVRIMYFVHNTLADLFLNPSDEARWIREPLDDLGGLSPLQYMLQKRIPGMLAVRAFVEQRLANR
jgi:hypothetical protein